MTTIITTTTTRVPSGVSDKLLLIIHEPTMNNYKQGTNATILIFFKNCLRISLTNAVIYVIALKKIGDDF